MKSTAKPADDKHEPNPILEAALRYRALRYSVIPVHSVVNERCTCGKKDCSGAGKHPALLSWKEYQKRAATEAQIRNWFTDHPELNVGIVTGKVSGIVVLDIDGEEGRQTLRELGYE